MYCLSIGDKDTDLIINAIKDFQIAEIRLDLCDFTLQEITKVFLTHPNLIATCRKTHKSYESQEAQLRTAINAGAAWIDIDITEHDGILLRELISLARSKKCKIILSYHDYEKVPKWKFIQSLVKKMNQFDHDFKKMVFTCNYLSDNELIKKIYQNYDNIISFNMGDCGKKSRIESLTYGAPFIYVSLENKNTASGQMTIEEIKKYS